ncbi:MAG: sodium:solute symporter family protein [Phycisphaeraceae bacterium]|nr:sodium:solute symporter family protein [Phycisphaeraceae bacterium]
MEQFDVIIQGSNFSTLDWGVVVVYLCISVVIGLIANRYIGNMTDYVVAGRGVRTALSVATLTGSELGLVTVMYNAQVGFSGGFSAFHIGLFAGVITFFVGMTGFIVADLRRHEVLTIPEFYGKRYGKGVRIYGALLLSLGGIFAMGMYLNTGAKFIVGITGLPMDGTMLKLIMVVLLALVLFYTVLGGMVSVIITDYIQFVVLSAGLLITTGIVLYHISWGEIVSIVVSEQGEAAYNPLMPDGPFGPGYMVWMAFLGLVVCAIWPTSVARALACDTEKTVKRQFMFGSLSFLIRAIIPFFWGIAAFAVIMTTPELQEAFRPGEGLADSVDSLFAMPVFLGRILPIGLIGLVTAAMIAAFMSTHDSYLLCWSSVLTNDVVIPLAGRELSQKTQIRITRVLIILIGITILLISFFFPLKQRLWDFMAMTAALYYCGAFALLIAGLYWKRASRVGAYAALTAGFFAFMGFEDFRSMIFYKLLPLSEGTADRFMEMATSAHVGLTTVGLACIGMVVGSLLFPDKASHNLEEDTA